MMVLFLESLGLGFGLTGLFFFGFELRLISIVMIIFMGYLLPLLTLCIIHYISCIAY